MLVSLQLGRGLAAVAVAAFHLSISSGLPKFGGDGERFLWEWAGRGNLGVDFFFVLSGFIILQAHQRDLDHPAQLRRYALRRAVRIFPIYWIYLSACIAGMLFVDSEYLVLNTPADWFTAYALIRVTDVQLPLGQAWTLFHELVFYVFFALLLCNRRLGIAALSAWLVALLYTFDYKSDDSLTFFDTTLGAYNLNFFVGMFAFLVALRARYPLALMLLLSGIALFVLNWKLNTWLGNLPEIKLAYAVSFGAIVSGAAALERQGRLMAPSTFGFIGDASYSIYLLHEHVQNYSLRLLMKLGMTSADHGALVFWLVMGITLLVGCLAYQWLERPLLDWLRRRVESGRASGAPLVTSPSVKG